MTPPDVTLMVAAFRARLLPPLPLTALGFGGVLDGLEPPDIAPLFDALVADHEAGWEIAVDLIGMYAFQNRERFDGLRPQVVRLADEVSRRPPMLRLPGHDHHLDQIVGWMLARGRAVFRLSLSSDSVSS